MLFEKIREDYPALKNIKLEKYEDGKHINISEYSLIEKVFYIREKYPKEKKTI